MPFKKGFCNAKWKEKTTSNEKHYFCTLHYFRSYRKLKLKLSLNFMFYAETCLGRHLCKTAPWQGLPYRKLLQQSQVVGNNCVGFGRPNYNARIPECGQKQITVQTN